MTHGLPPFPPQHIILPISPASSETSSRKQQFRYSDSANRNLNNKNRSVAQPLTIAQLCSERMLTGHTTDGGPGGDSCQECDGCACARAWRLTVAITHSESISSKTTQLAHFSHSLLKTSDVFSVCSRLARRLYQFQPSSPIKARIAFAKAAFNTTLFTSKFDLNLK
jgi:hypothetical protein